MKDRSLNENRIDRLVQLINATFGEIPIVGGAIVEFFSSVIPNQRTDRIIEFIKILNQRLSDQEQETFRNQILNEDFNGLLEDVVESTIKSIGKERKQHLVEVLKAGLNANKEETIELKLVTKTLKEINDIEVIILNSHIAKTSNEHHDFYQKHSSVLDARRLFSNADKNDEKKHYIYKGYLYHLVSLGLLDVNYEVSDTSNRILNKKEYKIKSKSHKLTEFGKMILDIINE